MSDMPEKLRKIYLDGLELLGLTKWGTTAYYRLELIVPDGVKGILATDIKYIPPHWSSSGKITKPRWEIDYIIQGNKKTAKTFSKDKILNIVNKVLDELSEERKRLIDNYAFPDPEFNAEMQYFWDNTEDGRDPSNRTKAIKMFDDLDIPRKDYIDAKWNDVFDPLSNEDKDKMRWGVRRVMQIMDYEPPQAEYVEELIVRSYDNDNHRNGDEDMSIEGESASIFPEAGAKSILFSARDEARKKRMMHIGVMVLAGLIALKLFYNKV